MIKKLLKIGKNCYVAKNRVVTKLSKILISNFNITNENRDNKKKYLNKNYFEISRSYL